MDECNEFVNHLALKLKDKIEGKKSRTKIIQMKKKQDKYFIYVSKDDK